ASGLIPAASAPPGGRGSVDPRPSAPENARLRSMIRLSTPRGGPMLCQTCQQAEAMIHVSCPVPVGPPDESHHCHSCYRTKEAERPPADQPAFSSSRFTIRGLMIAAFLFALLNAGLVLYMRNDPIPGTPVRMRDRMLKVLVIANLGLGMYLSEFI